MVLVSWTWHLVPTTYVQIRSVKRQKKLIGGKIYFHDKIYFINRTQKPVVLFMLHNNTRAEVTLTNLSRNVMSSSLDSSTMLTGTFSGSICTYCVYCQSSFPPKFGDKLFSVCCLASNCQCLYGDKGIFTSAHMKSKPPSASTKSPE